MKPKPLDLVAYSPINMLVSIKYYVEWRSRTAKYGAPIIVFERNKLKRGRGRDQSEKLKSSTCKGFGPHSAGPQIRQFRDE
mmetsp:Transcript_6525/g.9905  ORF Transcript_6525/g.9905 Transcript_6525/m.9905 type:complete len:81 (-) Transcript_6525:82-324(-)